MRLILELNLNFIDAEHMAKAGPVDKIDNSPYQYLPLIHQWIPYFATNLKALNHARVCISEFLISAEAELFPLLF